MLLSLVDYGHLMMEDSVFSQVQVQSVDLHYGNNSWLPAYGFQTPAALLSKEEYVENNGMCVFLTVLLHGECLT